jgi:hypothetical protein
MCGWGVRVEEEQAGEGGEVCACVSVNLDPLRRLPVCGPPPDSPATLWKWSLGHLEDVSELVTCPRRRVEERAVGTRVRNLQRSCHRPQLKILDARWDSK